jgi:glycosyltransferase involved in cell wall biosynthesis
MKIVLLTPGTGSYHCGVCMRDNALAKELIREGHDAIMLPMYLPLALDESAASPDAPVFFGGVSVYLQQKFALFRSAPRWLDRILNAPFLLRIAGRFSGMTATSEVGELTHSMLLGEEGKQAGELEALIDWLRGHRPDAVWLSTALLLGLARRIRAVLGVPIIASLQGEDSFVDGLPEPWKGRCWQALADRSADVDALVAPSRFYADFMGGRMRLQASQLRVIPNGIGLEGYEQSARPSGDAPVIGFLSRFIAGKGLGFLIDAFIELKCRGRFPDLRLRCAGAMTDADGRYVQTLRAKLDAAGFSDAVEFLPNISREDKIAFLRSLTLFTVPASYGEAFGLYLVEALAAGVPVVQPKTAAFPEFVEATGGGVLYEHGNVGALVDAWEALLADPARARALGAVGREAIFRDFSVPRMAEHFLALTRDCAKPSTVDAQPA